ncbi:MAG TPA: site-specific integrase, partial [Lysobacter sp.]|nr:site-specific integrase [Lysobacter sp.]
RKYKMVDTEATAKALVREVLKQEILGVNVIAAIEKARAVAPVTPSYPKLRDALPAWIDGQVAAGDIRASTEINYKSRLSKWVYPTVGGVPVNQITREQLGEVIRRMREAGLSRTTIGHVCHPLRGYFTWLIETKQFPGPNPAGDLKFFKGKGKKPRRDASFFTQEEGPKLVAAATVGYPRWSAFIMTGLLAGLRWGESAALFKSDIDWKRGRVHVARTVSKGSSRLEGPKDHDGRWVKASPALLKALREHIEAMDLDGQVEKWTPEVRQLVFPTAAGKVAHYGSFLENVWQPLLKKAGLPYRKYHSTRHSYATWLLSDGADIRWVQKQLGHSTITLTADTYGHVQPERHESAVEVLDRYVR